MFDTGRITKALLGQMIGLINGAFFALLSLGLAVIFGRMNVINSRTARSHDGRVRCVECDLSRQPLWGVLCWHRHLPARSACDRTLFICASIPRSLYAVAHFGLALVLEALFRASTASPARIQIDNGAPIWVHVRPGIAW